MHRLIQAQPLDIGPVESRAQQPRTLAGHLRGIEQRGEFHVLRARGRLDAPDETAEADWTAAAQRDLVEIFDGDLLIAFTDDGVGSGRGGHHAEFGAALTAATFWPTAWATKWPWIVGPRQHVLHFHPGVRHFATWADALAALTTGTREQADGFSPADWIDQ